MEKEEKNKITIKEHIQNMKKVLDLMTELDKTYFFFTSIVHIINVAVPYLGLLLSSYILDSLTEKSFQEIMTVTVSTLVGIFLLNFIASTIWNRMEVRRNQSFYLYESMIQVKMLKMDFSEIDSPKVRKLQEKIMNDMNWGWGLNTVFFQVNGILYGIYNIIGAILVGGPVFLLMFTSKRYEVLLIFLFVILAAVLGLKKTAEFEKKESDTLRNWDEADEFCSICWTFPLGNGYHYKNGKDVRIYDGYDLLKRWSTDTLHKKVYRKNLKERSLCRGAAAGFYGSLHTAMEGCSYLIVSLVALGGMVSVGNVVRFAGCLKNLIAAVLGLINDTRCFALRAQKHLSTFELLDLSNEMYDGKLPVEKRSDNQYQIEFRDVSFRYPGSEQYALKHFSMKLTIGEKLAIVGMNGSGKTTMIKLLCRLYDPDEGEILLNGVDIRKFKQEEYSRLFSVVFQDYVLFPFTVAENVAVSVDYDSELVTECLDGAGFGERLSGLDQGIGTYLRKDFDDSGVEMSGGEEQKLAIARAVYKDAPFILLDEPTAALDPLSEYEVYTNFDKIIGTKTAIYISHRLSSCRFCEKIAVFHEGELVQMGRHEELVQDKNGKYYEMWRAQAQYYQG
jgi:ATP-binding cassette subfamily B protein